MSGLTPINGWSTPALNDSPNITTAINTALNAIDARANPIFSTTAARDAAIPSPTEGMEAYVTGTKEKYIYNGTTWVGRTPRVVSKAVTESVTSSTVLQADDHLFLSVEANSSYLVGLNLIYDAAAAGDLAFRITAPAGATAPTSGILVYLNASDTLLLDAYGLGNTNTAGGGGASAFRALILQNLPVNISSTSGTIALSWAQGTSNATASRITQGSTMTLMKIG